VEISLDGKVALVTGASRGIGKAIARAYADAGASVLLSSRKLGDLESAAADIGGDVDVTVANAGDPDQASAAVDRCIERFGGIDILVNNAATNPYMGPAIDIDLPRYDKTWQVNLRGPLVWTQLAHRASMAEHGGSVINIASIGGLSVEPSIGVYNTTKAAIIYLTKTLAAELGPGVRVNAIAPGLVKTDFARPVGADVVDDARRHLVERVLLARRQQHRRAVVGVDLRDRPADPLRRAGHERHLALQRQLHRRRR